MVTIPGVPQFVLWLGFIILIVIMLLIDLGLFNKKKHTITVKEALIWTIIWFSVAMLFNLFILYEFGSKSAIEFLTGYVIEKALSVDNLFVILLIFTSFKVHSSFQHRLLFWGILGALVMRGAMILIGAALVEKFTWILYIFGAFLLYTGAAMFFKKDEKYDPHDSFVMKLINRFFKVHKGEHGGKFFVKEAGKSVMTILFVTLIVIEFTDVMFAFDSIPAIFGITTDPFIVFTSNIFAILGLRSLYFVLLHAHKNFTYISHAVALILIFIGFKMLSEPFLHINLLVSLFVVFGLLIVAIIASIFLTEKRRNSIKRLFYQR